MSDTLLQSPPPNPAQPLRRRRAVALGVALLLLAVLAYGGKVAYGALLGAPDWSGNGTGQVVVQIQAGDSASDIGTTLVAKGVVRSRRAFTNAAKSDNASRDLQPGFYRLRLHMSAKAALRLLLDPASRLRGRVTLPEGIPLSNVVARLVKYTELKRPDIIAALQNPAVLGLPSWADDHPEGFLFPATYDVEPGTAAVDALQMMTEKFAEVAAGLNLEAGAAQLHLTPYQVVTIASIIEQETPLDADRPKVARVILNRLARNMPLQLDSTVNYLRTERKARLSLADIAVQSPWNTYLHRGLPPTPIDSPGEAALTAALHPAAGDWIYFVTIDKAGHSLFTNSYSDFLRAKAKAQRDGVY